MYSDVNRSMLKFNPQLARFLDGLQTSYEIDFKSNKPDGYFESNDDEGDDHDDEVDNDDSADDDEYKSPQNRPNRYPNNKGRHPPKSPSNDTSNFIRVLI